MSEASVRWEDVGARFVELGKHLKERYDANTAFGDEDRQKEGFGGDVERLFVSQCSANQGPSMKRIRPAPMGRAFRVVKRTAHLTVRVAERPAKVVAPASAPETGAEGASARPRRKGHTERVCAWKRLQRAGFSWG